MKDKVTWRYIDCHDDGGKTNVTERKSLGEVKFIGHYSTI